MITADELLEQAAAMAETRTAIPENEMHIVVDNNRYAIVPDILKNIAVQRDHNIETVTFDCPRYWDGHDLLDLELKIVWERADGYSEPHLVENLRVDEIDSTILHFEWTITNKVTAIPGKIKFSVCGKLTDADGVLEREWHTHPNEEMYTAEGMDCSGEEVLDSNPDILNAILTRIALLEGTGKHGGAPFIEAWLSEELAKRQQLAPEFANNIDECSDTSKLYVLPDGYIYAYMHVESIDPGGEPLFVNRANPQSSDWHADTRLSSTSSEIKSCVGSVVSNVILAKNGDIIRIKGLRNGTVTATANSYVSIAVYSDEAGTATVMNPTICFDKTKAQHSYGVKDIVEVADGVITYNAFEFVANNGNTEQLMLGPIVSVRVCGEPVTTVDDIVVTVNEEIRYSEASSVQGYVWQSTGHAFVPANYEARILAVEKESASNAQRIAELEERVENGLSEVLTDSERLNLIKLWDKPVYDTSPVTLIADDRAKPALTTADRTITAIYAKYRELMARFPQYITETNMGKSSSSDIFEAVDMLRFDFKEPDGRTNSGYTLYEKKPKLIFMSGVHTEWAGVWGLYYALEEILTNPDFDDIRRNAHIIVVPCSNPFCLNGWTSSNGVDGWRMSHVNANGVAIHNNFNVDHSTSGTVGEYNYGGTAPCSEPETQYIDQIMAENPDAVAFVSCHNNDYCTEFGTSVIWASSATAHMCNIVFRLVDKLSKAWLNKYGQTLIDAINTYKTDALPEGDYRLGRAQLSTSKGTEAKNALKYGIQGVNVEISRMMKVFSGSVDGTSEVMTHGAEVYANLMRTLLATYDHKDKLVYSGGI